MELILCYALLEFTVFSNILKDTQIHELADSDGHHEVVQQVQVLVSLKCSIDCALHLGNVGMLVADSIERAICFFFSVELL